MVNTKILGTIHREIAPNLAVVTDLEIAVAEYIDWFLPFCVAGLSLLGLYLLMQLGLRYTPW